MGLLTGGGLLSGGSGINVFQHVQLNVIKTLTLSTCLICLSLRNK